MKRYAIWVEGYRATGEHGTATCMGSAIGDTFSDAVRNLLKTKSTADRAYYNLTNTPPTYWGCRLFDNEKDARKSFG